MVRAFIACLAALSLWACAAPPEQPGPGEAPPAAVERVIAPTPAMLVAALSGNATAMRAAATQTGCPAPSTCPTSFGACTGWSAPSQCSQTCTESPLCTCPIVIEHPDFPPEPCEPDLSIRRGRNTFSAFRVCFNSAQQACTEWRQSVNFFCGC